MGEAEDLLRRYAAMPVPRYTSYPTAAEFSVTVGATEQERWLRRVDGDRPVSVYLHVPYCRDLCHYCGCHAKAYRRDSVIDSYRAALEAEIGTVAASARRRLKVGRIHWGGGTPSSLGAEGLASVMAVLARYFEILPDAEHAIELDPRLVDAPLAAALAALGVNRVSLGVQDTDPLVQAAIGRIQPEEQVVAAFAALRQAGIDAINVDLIYGLPLQTVKSLRRTCAKVAALRPARVACYGYAHMPHRRANQKRISAVSLPGPDDRVEQAATVAEALMQSGYAPVGIDHYALPGDALLAAQATGRLHRNFQGYTDDDCAVLIGFGASAISHLPDGFVQNEPDTTRYVRIAQEGLLAGIRGCRVSEEDRLRGRIIEALMCQFAVDLDLIAPQKDFSDELALIRPMVRDGLVTVEGRRLWITETGKPLVRVVATLFDSFRRQTSGRFSLAV
ncbi:oxygen-independent coproporphyrinogen III oxidase [Rhizobium rhizosphaerae]|uniref:Coproporphyrinogen-III oxidase n=1 Tax=Xaviernesmea rhizosphaerae TaxID=1672749 RepID=A0A1Q9ALD2_9HYPH|nr:oxygen-independent coproporphyrinogen III oxidase [Xaviernesmea rhizosphaerae]OLP56138.1 oxygen-independent coproporphyrinogen III oxidase [Xaviernesmea rhizosphaerae]